MKKREICKVENDYFKIEYDLTKGMWDCYKDGKIFIKNAYGEIDSRQKIITTMDQGYERRYETKKIFDNVGPGEVLEVIHIGNNDLPEFKLSIVLYQEKQLLVLKTKVGNSTKYDMDVLEICPIKVSYETQGSLFFGDPKRCKVLQSVFGMGSPDQLTKPIVSKCELRCWWSTGICNTETNEGFITGVLGPANNETAIIVGYDEQSSERGIEFSIRGGCYTDKGPGSFKEGGNKERRPLILKVNRSFSMSEIVLLTDKHILDGLEKYADHLRDYNQIKLWPKPVTGFFTGYSVDKENRTWHNLNEENVHHVVEFLSKVLRKYGLEYIKIEFGLMGSPNIFDPFAVNMEYVGGYRLEEHFPKGIPALTEGIHKSGFKAAWQSRTFLYVKGSEPNEIEKTREIYDVAIRKWGFDYLMLDFNSWDAETISQSRPLIEVIKDRFAAIRRTVGRDIFIEGCMYAWGPMVGLVNGYRPSADFRAGLEDELLKGFASRYYLHGRVFYNDAEFLDVLEKPFPPQLGIGGGPEKTLQYSFEETKTWASLVGIAGLSLLAGGYLPAVGEERLEILKALLPVYNRGARPLDLFERDLPRVWDLRVDKNFDSWHVVGLFNWDYEKEQEVKIDFEKCGLEKSEEYLLFDFWEKRFLGEGRGSFSRKLAPRHCTIISIHTKANRPQLLSTTRHITQGGIEIVDMKWDNRTNTLSGISIGPKETSHSLFIHVPTKYRLKKTLGVEVERMENAILQIRLKFDASEEIEWIVTFSTS